MGAGSLLALGIGLCRPKTARSTTPHPRGGLRQSRRVSTATPAGTNRPARGGPKPRGRNAALERAHDGKPETRSSAAVLQGASTGWDLSQERPNHHGKEGVGCGDVGVAEV
jgi:hypothetical protein